MQASADAALAVSPRSVVEVLAEFRRQGIWQEIFDQSDVWVVAQSMYEKENLGLPKTYESIVVNAFFTPEDALAWPIENMTTSSP